MIDPLHDFDWPSLYERYDRRCKGFNPAAVYLSTITPTPQSDRELYYCLIDHIHTTTDDRPRLSIDLYEALLYWKLYSNPLAVSNIRRWLDSGTRSVQAVNLTCLLRDLPRHLDRKVDDVVALVKLLDRYQVPGMKSTTALPVRTTLLHYLFPEVVPIFDKMVLRAVELWSPRPNENVAVLREYLPHAWNLADRHASHLPGQWRETPVRLIDMALWVVRGGGSAGKTEGTRGCPT